VCRDMGDTRVCSDVWGPGGHVCAGMCVRSWGTCVCGDTRVRTQGTRVCRDVCEDLRDLHVQGHV